MKANSYITFFLVVSFFFAKAQNSDTQNKYVSCSLSTVSCIKQQPIKIFKFTQNKSKLPIGNNCKIVGFSDIRLFFNRERKIDNLSLLFPKVYKEAKV